MPRGRSKSKTPGKKKAEVVASSKEEEEKIPTPAPEEGLPSPSSAAKRRRTRSISDAAKEDLVSLPIPDRSTPIRRRRRASSAASSSASVTQTTPSKAAESTAEKKTKKEKRKSTAGSSNKKNEKRLSSSSPSRKASSSSKQAEKIVISQENDIPPALPFDKKKPADAPKTIKKTTPKVVAKYPPTLNVKVHRVRHLDYLPSEVLAMTSTTNDSGSSLVAISRKNGSLELVETTFIQDYANSKKWSPHLFPIATIAGSKRAVAHSLAFVNLQSKKDNSGHTVSSSPALVAASPDGTLWTVQFAGHARQLHSRITSGGGGVFDLATCGRQLPLVAGACQDGSVRIWQVGTTVANDGRVGPVKIQEPPIATLSTAGAPVLSVAWRIEKQVGDTFDTVVFAGVADGTIRKYRVQLETQTSPFDNDSISVKCSKHAADLRMTIESRGRRTATKVWTMQALDDRSLVTGNSLGQIQIFDTVTGTLLQSINQTELKADVLKVAVNAAHTKIFASGVDSRVVCLERSATTPDATWKFTNAQRPHTHDVKAMTIVQSKASNGNQMEALLSGGVDTKLCTYLVTDFAKKRPHVCYPWPSQSPISSTSTAGNDETTRRLVSIHRDGQIELYRLDEELASKKETPNSTSELIAEIAPETQSNLTLSTMSPNGTWLAAANATKVFLFRVFDPQNSGEDVQVEMHPLSKSVEQLTATALHFHEDTLFVAGSRQEVFAVDLSNQDAESNRASKLTLPLGSQTSDLPICSIQTSLDGTYLAVMSKMGKTGAVHVYHRPSQSTSYEHYWTLPGLPNTRAAAIALIGSSQLAVATSSFHIYVFDLAAKKLSPWSEENQFPIESWPTEISFRKDFPVRLFANPKDESQLIMVSHDIVLTYPILLQDYARKVITGICKNLFLVFCWLVTLAKISNGSTFARFRAGNCPDGNGIVESYIFFGNSPLVCFPNDTYACYFALLWKF